MKPLYSMAMLLLLAGPASAFERTYSSNYTPGERTTYRWDGTTSFTRPDPTTYETSSSTYNSDSNSDSTSFSDSFNSNTNSRTTTYVEDLNLDSIRLKGCILGICKTYTIKSAGGEIRDSPNNLPEDNEYSEEELALIAEQSFEYGYGEGESYDGDRKKDYTDQSTDSNLGDSGIFNTTFDAPTESPFSPL